jgi:3-hydroxybutyryl-CoA dehydratase
MKKLFDEITIGDKFIFSKTIESCDVYSFAGITGDFNPAHLNEEFAKNTMFKTRIAHGMLGTGLISGAISQKVSTDVCVIVKQNVTFKKPVYPGDTVTVNLEVISCEDEIRTLQTDCVNQNGDIVIEGKAAIAKF